MSLPLNPPSRSYVGSNPATRSVLPSSSTLILYIHVTSSIQVHHGVEISDGALVTGLFPLTSTPVVPKLTTSSAAVYADRYISDRFLPDKAIDLVDEAASSLRLAQESKPDALEQLDHAVMTMQIELTSLRNESDPLSTERRDALEQALERTRKEAAALEERWQAGT